MDGRVELGRRGEALAAALLQAQGLTIVERNFRCRAGEIDLVALDGPTLVFVEVRSRRSDRLGTPFESVDPRKQARVTRVARHFLAARGFADREVRFDVVGIRFDVEPPALQHLRGAFEAAG